MFIVNINSMYIFKSFKPLFEYSAAFNRSIFKNDILTSPGKRNQNQRGNEVNFLLISFTYKFSNFKITKHQFFYKFLIQELWE